MEISEGNEIQRRGLKVRLLALVAVGMLTILGSAEVLADGCPPTGATCYLNQDVYYPGDQFNLLVDACNQSETEEMNAALFLILDIYGYFYFWPSWSQELNFGPLNHLTIPPCSCLKISILEFVVPEGIPSLDIIAYAALTDEDMTALLGEFSMCPFSFKP